MVGVIQSGFRFTHALPRNVEWIPFGDDIIVCPQAAPPYVLREEHGLFVRVDIEPLNIDPFGPLDA